MVLLPVDRHLPVRLVMEKGRVRGELDDEILPEFVAVSRLHGHLLHVDAALGMGQCCNGSHGR